MKIKTILGVALAAGTLASCSVEDNESTGAKVNEEYTREFIKQFGTIDPNQDWSVAEQKSVTIDVASPSHVKIFEKQGAEYRLAADYKDVTKQTITFDGMKGDDTPFLVFIGDAAYAAENGQTLTIGSAAKGSMLRADKIPDEYRTWIDRGNKAKIKLSTSDGLMNSLATNNGKSTVLDNNLVNEIVSGHRGLIGKDQTISFYPMYWNSPKKHVVGIYYNDNNGQLVHIPMYADKTDTYKDDPDKEDLSFYTVKNPIFDTSITCRPVQTDAEDCWHYANTLLIGDNSWDVEYYSGFTFRSRVYTINPPTSLAAGIYVEVDGKKYYSDPALNGGKSFFAQRVITSGNGSIDGASCDTYTYVCFDDPDDNGGEGDKDYNDVVLFTPSQMNAITQNETEWTIACEDLGGTYDYDFNDIVFRVRHVSGNDYAYIFPVAAGGTLKAHLFYNNKEISDEWHSHFGNGHEFNVMINTGKGPEEHAVKTIRLEGLPTDWSISALSKNSNGLSIKVERTDGTIASVTGPEKGAAPQMLILPYDWQWPTELTRITTAYPGFGEWGANYTNSSWLSNKVTESIVSGFGDGEITSNGQKTVPVNN